MKTITGHMLVKNEDCWIWFSLMSVIDYLDKLIIFDNGSTDKTVAIIKNVMKIPQYRNKIIFEEHPKLGKEYVGKLRQRMLDMTDTDYFMLVDGDEIWWKESMEELLSILNSGEVDMVATRFCNCAGGDIRHYRDFGRESFKMENIVGSIMCRVFSRTIPGIHFQGEYGVEGCVDGNNRSLHTGIYRTVVMEKWFFHTSLLRRSSLSGGDARVYSRMKKLLLRSTYDYAFPDDFKYPEVFYIPYPTSLVRNPWEKERNPIRVLNQLAYNIKKRSFHNRPSEDLQGKNCLW